MSDDESSDDEFVKRNGPKAAAAAKPAGATTSAGATAAPVSPAATGASGVSALVTAIDKVHAEAHKIPWNERTMEQLEELMVLIGRLPSLAEHEHAHKKRELAKSDFAKKKANGLLSNRGEVDEETKKRREAKKAEIMAERERRLKEREVRTHRTAPRPRSPAARSNEPRAIGRARWKHAPDAPPVTARPAGGEGKRAEPPPRQVDARRRGAGSNGRERASGSASGGGACGPGG